MTYESTAENESPVADKLRKLLFAYAVWDGIGGNRRCIAIMTGQICSSPTARIMKDALEQCVELDVNDRISFQICFSDACMLYVKQLVRALPKKFRKIIIAEYFWYENLPRGEKARRLKISRRCYYYRLDRAHQAIDIAMDWSLTR